MMPITYLAIAGAVALAGALVRYFRAPRCYVTRIMNRHAQTIVIGADAPSRREAEASAWTRAANFGALVRPPVDPDAEGYHAVTVRIDS